MPRKLYYVIFILCLYFSSCDYYQVVPVEFINQSSLPVELSYSKITMSYHDSILYDTVFHELAVGASLKTKFHVWWGGKKTLSKDISFFKFKTPEKSMCLEGPKEVIRVFNKEGRFVVTDSLFNCGNKQ